MTPEEIKRYRERANRAKRELLKEKQQYGYINDGSGKRYLAPVYYVLAGDNDKALAFYTWFEEEFDDDIGEPVFDSSICIGCWLNFGLATPHKHVTAYKSSCSTICTCCHSCSINPSTNWIYGTGQTKPTTVT